jgi:hypothetical protein
MADPTFRTLDRTRRDFLRAAAWNAAGGTIGLMNSSVLAQLQGERPNQASGVKVLNPRNRVPLSLIIDDSTCLANLAHFCIPQFQELFPDQYKQDWKKLPREIPDAFVREFGEWCRERGVKGKYSVIPNPACVGWLDRDLPGWSRKELDASLTLVREFLARDWDFHPEMITHTWVIDTKTGRPYAERSERFMENWGWTDGKSVDQLAEYLRYALRILKNVGLTCEGITTPGGFGNGVLPELAQATLQACRDVFQVEIPHYFRHTYVDERSVAPRVEYASRLEHADPQCVVSIISCTGDWTGGWDGLAPVSADQFITRDGRGGRLPEVINRGEPAVMFCHWPGMFYNGEKRGFHAFQEVVKRVHEKYDNLLWMKLSEIARYWAARELTRIDKEGKRFTLRAPFSTPCFTLEIKMLAAQGPRLVIGDQTTALREVRKTPELVSGTYYRDKEGVTVCIDLPRGESALELP